MELELLASSFALSPAIAFGAELHALANALTTDLPHLVPPTATATAGRGGGGGGGGGVGAGGVAESDVASGAAVAAWLEVAVRALNEHPVR